VLGNTAAVRKESSVSIGQVRFTAVAVKSLVASNTTLTVAHLRCNSQASLFSRSPSIGAPFAQGIGALPAAVASLESSPSTPSPGYCFPSTLDDDFPSPPYLAGSAHPDESRFSQMSGYGLPEDLVKAYGIRAEPHGAPAPRNAAPERYPTDTPSDDENAAALLSEINHAVAQPCRSPSPGSVLPDARLAFFP
jgi:hypothetical protein